MSQFKTHKLPIAALKHTNVLGKTQHYLVIGDDVNNQYVMSVGEKTVETINKMITDDLLKEAQNEKKQNTKKENNG